MMTILLLCGMMAASLFLLAESGRAGKAEAAQIVLSKAWRYRFARQTLTEKKEEFIENNRKYGTVKAKRAAKKVKEWEKQIAEYQDNEDKYLSGQKFTVLDCITLFGYQILEDLKIDGNNDLLRKLTVSCEHTGYVELERNQETSGKKNSFLYAYFLIASLFSFLFAGGIVSCFLGVLMISMGKSTAAVVAAMSAGFACPTLYGYLPYDDLRLKARKRQEEIDQGFPNAISEIALLVTAGMSITKAMEEAAVSGDSLIYREFRLVIREMNQAATIQEALTRLKCRCDNKYLDKMVTIVAKSYTAGNANLAGDLKAINDECWLDKKHNTRRMGEVVQNKLFIPTMLMFIGILIVIIVPAMSGFNL